MLSTIRKMVQENVKNAKNKKIFLWEWVFSKVMLKIENNSQL